jgi:hypothetical protein
MTAIAWPPLLVSCAPDVYYDARTVSGGTSLTGKEQIAARDFGIWRAVLSAIKITSDDQVLALDALLAQLDGRAGTVMVPFFAARRAPYLVSPPPLLGSIITPVFERRFPELSGTPFEYETRAIVGTATLVSSGLLTFTQTSGPAPKCGNFVTLFGVRRAITSVNGAAIAFVAPVDLGTPVRGPIVATLNASAAARAATVSLNMISGAVTPRPGMHFSIAGGPGAYRIREIVSVAGSIVTCKIRPGLRASASNGSSVDLETPSIEMRLVSDDQGRGPLDMWRTKTTSLEFIEA